MPVYNPAASDVHVNKPLTNILTGFHNSKYIADEIFFSGTAAEITPITKVDGICVGDGKRGSMTKAIQDYFFNVVNGESEDKYKWLTYI